MSSIVVRGIKNACPDFFTKHALEIVRKGRWARCKAAMLLSSGRMSMFCPCCGMKVKSFIAGNFLEHTNVYDPARYVRIKQEVLCPCCKALPRHRILASWCDDNKKMLSAAEILYFAPEYSMMMWMKRNGIACTTADLFQESDLKLDIQATGLPDESYDVIICNHVLEHVDDFQAALNEMHRILRQGGCFICSFPMDPKIELLDEEEGDMSVDERIRRFGQNDHKRVFGMKADVFLAEAGFDVKTIDGEFYPKDILPVVGPADYDINRLFLCEKK